MASLLNHPAPDVDLVDLETGDMHSLHELMKRHRDTPTIVLFYATWSKACIDEVETFEAWSKINARTHLANFVLINVDQNVGKALEFVDEINEKTRKPRVCRDYRNGEAPTVLHFGCADIPEPYGVLHVPHKVMIDGEGVVRRNADDFHWDDIAGLMRYRRDGIEYHGTDTFLFPTMLKT